MWGSHMSFYFKKCFCVTNIPFGPAKRGLCTSETEPDTVRQKLRNEFIHIWGPELGKSEEQMHLVYRVLAFPPFLGGLAYRAVASRWH